MFAQVKAVVARKNHDGVVFLPGRRQCRHHLTHLRVHKRNRRVIAADRLFLFPDIHLHVQASAIVDARLRNIIPIALDLGR